MAAERSRKRPIDALESICRTFEQDPFPECLRSASDAYAGASEQVSPVDRRDLVCLFGDEIDADALTHKVMWPIFYGDPEPGVRCTASLTIVEAAPLEGDDPMTSTRQMLDVARKAPDSATRGVAIAGILMTGDRRVLPLLDGCWEMLDLESAHLVVVHGMAGYAFAAHAEFYLAWLRAIVDDPAQEGIFGTAAAGLSRLAASNPTGIVLDVERPFPMRNGKSIKMLNSWTVPEYARRIARPLRALARREHSPRVLPFVLDIWGLA